jgi:peptidoglycan/xylan/chitin deacetylase (PgdA/CDA1 family)
MARGWNERHDRLKGDQGSLGTPSPSWEDCYGGNLSVPRGKLVEVGGFALDLPANSDIELGYRLEQHGLAVVYIPGARGDYHDHRSFRARVAEAEQLGSTSVEVSRRHPGTQRQLLGSYHDATWPDRALRRTLLALDPPVWLLSFARVLFAGSAGETRWARFLYRHFYWRGVKRAMSAGLGASGSDTWERLTHGTPILTYHAFAGPGERVGRYVISASRFERQLAWLEKKGYQVLSLEAYLCYRASHRLPPARSVVITIDDGYGDVRSVAYPILRRYGVPATVFVVPDYVGLANGWDANSELARRALLSWPEIGELVEAGGIEIGSHTRSHRPLSGMPTAKLEKEVRGSRAELERRLGIPVRTFAYPFGDYDVQAQLAVQQGGFGGGCGDFGGVDTMATPVYNLRRIEITGRDSMIDFCLKVRLGTNRVRPYIKELCSLVASFSVRPSVGRALQNEPEQRTLSQHG